MTRITRVSILTLPALAVALIGAAGCSSANSPTQTGVGGSVSHGTGGSTGTSTVAETTGGAATGTTGGAAAGNTGGAPAGDTGGAPAGDTGGAPAGTGGSTGSGTLGQPLCGTLVDGVTAIAKNVACTAADTQLCYKTCGPLSSGFKTETCTGGAYAEQSGTITCSFDPAGNYACYKIPTTYDASCPASTAPPQATKPCTVAACTVCGPAYLDSGGASKVGYCVCNATATNPTWSCASTSAWPCPGGAGCT